MGQVADTLRQLRASRTAGHVLACAGLVALTAAVFSNALRLEFVNFDDWFLIEQDRTIRSLSWHNVARMLFWVSDQGVWLPLRVLSYAVDYRFWGMDAFGFHLTNLLLHLANVLLAYAVLNWLLRRPWLAALGAAWFAVHPVQVESVTWVSGRRDVLYALFFLSAFLTFVGHERASGGKRWVLYVASLVLTACSLLSKASGMMLPGVLLLAVFVSSYPRKRGTGTFSQSGEGASPQGETERPLWQRVAAIVPYGLLALAATIRHYQFASQSEVIKGALFGKHLASMPWIFASYWRLLFFPVQLSTPQARVPVRWNETEVIIIAIVAVVAVVAVAWWAAPRRSLALFCLGWWFLLLLPFSNLVPLSMLVAERYLYLPLLGASAFGAALVGSLATRWKWPTVACAIAVVGLFAAATHSRNRVWSDSRTFWWDGISKWPGAPVPRVGLADAYTSTGQLALAWRQYMAVILPTGVAFSQNPEHIKLVHRGLLYIYDRLGRQLESEGRMDGALDVYVITVQQMPNEIGPRVKLAEAYERRGMVGKAREQVLAAQRLDAKYPGLVDWLKRLTEREPKRGGQ